MPHPDQGFCSIDDALDELRAGRMVVLVDDEHRENEGDLVAAAESITPAAVNFMIRHACGRLCVSFSKANADRLGLELLPGVNLDPAATPFTHNFDARHGVGTGISAFDRSRTIQVCADPASGPQDLVAIRGTSMASSPVPAASSSARDTPKGAWTCAGWRDCAKSPSSAKC